MTSIRLFELQAPSGGSTSMADASSRLDNMGSTKWGPLDLEEASLP